MEASILIPPNWQLEFHVHTYASLLIVGAMLTQNPIGKYDQPIFFFWFTTLVLETQQWTYAIFCLGVVFPNEFFFGGIFLP
jgi:hypothetical protein